MEQSCRRCQTVFDITDEDLSLYEKMSPVVDGKKYDIPFPTLCPLCRMQRRIAYRNTRTLYRSSSALSGESCISMYDPESGFVVYTQKEWWSDDWDPLNYGQAIDYERSIFDQIRELRMKVPRFNVFNMDSVNSEYVNYAPHVKDCYLIFGSWFSENCMYGVTIMECKNCVDNLCLQKCELCYQCVDCEVVYHSFYCQSCSNCNDCYYCFDCKGLRNCIGCWNLRNKEYYVFNQPVSKEEFESLRTKFSSYTFAEKFRSEFQDKKSNMQFING
jgi:hypothetical protein